MTWFWFYFATHILALPQKCFSILKIQYQIVFSRKSDSTIANVCLSVTETTQPLRIAPIDHWTYWPSSLLTIKPINHWAYWPLSLSTIMPIDLWSSFATFKPFGLFVILHLWLYHISFQSLKWFLSCPLISQKLQIHKNTNKIIPVATSKSERLFE